MQQEEKWHKDLELYWGSWGWISNAAKSLWEQGASQRAFMVVCRVPLEEQRDVGEMLVGRREEGR